MLGHSAYYHETTKNIVSAVGTIFNDLEIIRKDPNDANRTQRVKIPLVYASRDKAFSRRSEDPGATYHMQVTFPKIAFILNGIEYDPSRKLQGNQYVSSVSGLVASQVYQPVPYNLSFSVHIGVNHYEDGLQVIEQILPFFNPEYTVTTKDFPQFNLKRDVPIILDGVELQDNTADSDYSDYRIIEWTLNITAKAYYYGPVVSDRAIIKDTKNFIFIFDETMQEGEHDVLINSKVNPLSANKDDPHSIDTTITER